MKIPAKWVDIEDNHMTGWPNWFRLKPEYLTAAKVVAKLAGWRLSEGTAYDEERQYYVISFGGPNTIVWFEYIHPKPKRPGVDR